MSEEQKKGVEYHPCYTLSELMHIGKDEQCFIISGYQWGPGNIDELVQAEDLVRDFDDAVGKGTMNLCKYYLPKKNLKSGGCKFGLLLFLVSGLQI